MKILRWIAWISAAIAVVIIIVGLISLAAGKVMCGFNHPIINYFHAANSFLLLAIALFIATKQCCCDKCACKEEKKES